MKKLILTILLASTIWSCSSDSTESDYRLTNVSQTVVEPVTIIDGVYSKGKKNKHWVTIQWHTPYGYPYPVIQPHYATVYQDGVLKHDYFNAPYNQCSIEVTAQWTQSEFMVTQTLIGVGTSAPAYITVYKDNSLNKKR